MKLWKKKLIRNGDNQQEFVEEEDDFKISNGCCYFHDQEEFDEFDDIDDDAPKEA